MFCKGTCAGHLCVYMRLAGSLYCQTGVSDGNFWGLENLSPEDPSFRNLAKHLSANPRNAFTPETFDERIHHEEDRGLNHYIIVAQCIYL